ncbi:MAG TPA: FAD-dependent oxidoreductase, partial [Flavobacterium sp.]|nr:FAD-dependent oxidoreductase [Flavobacterium sp.]
MERSDVIVVGGGLAGLAAGIHLAKHDKSVIIIEKSSYPTHKVCGEYLSNEIVPYLNWLGICTNNPEYVPIDDFTFCEVSGNIVSTALPMGGISISRYKLDHRMYLKAVEAGCSVVKEMVKDIVYNAKGFTVYTDSGTFSTELVLGAFGKWSNIDKQLKRRFAFKKSSWLAVKAHYKNSLADNTVGLYSFPGGYCGVSKVDVDTVNICYLTKYNTFKTYKNIRAFEEAIVFENRKLKDIMTSGTMKFDKPLAISQLSFKKKEPVKNHILMIGDSAGLIHPLCGNGMAMAIHSAKIAVELSMDFLDNKVNRSKLEQNYRQLWN